MSANEHSEKAKELLPTLKGLSVWDARRVLEAASIEVQKAGNL